VRAGFLIRGSTSPRTLTAHRVCGFPAATATPWRWPQTRLGIMIGITSHLSVWRLEIVNGFPYAVTYGQPGA